MDTLRKGLAVICSGLLVISTVLAVILFNLEASAFTPELYQRVFANENFYERIPMILGQALASGEKISGLPISMQGLTAQNWEDFLRAVLPAETLKAMGDQVLNSLFAYLNKQSDSAVISMLPLKASLTGDSGVQAMLGLLRTQPPCTLEQIAQITLAALTQGEISLCNPPEAVSGLITPLIESQLQLTAAVLPNEITITAVQDPQNDPRDLLKEVRFMMRLSPILPLTFLFLLTLLIVRSLTDWLKWWGIPLFISGTITALMRLAGAPVTGLILTKVLEYRIPFYLPAVLLDNTNQLAAAIVEELLKPVLWEGLALLLIGLTMILISMYLSKSKPMQNFP